MKKINLLKIESGLLSSKEALSIIGGNTCGCACRYANHGGSSTSDNAQANRSGNLVSIGFRLQDCKEIWINDQVW